MLNKKYRINHKEDYHNLYKYGKRYNGKYIIIYIKVNKLKYSRFGVVASKKVGKAVIRNRVKRQIRAIIQEINKKITGSSDMVIIAKKTIDKSNYSLIEKDFRGILGKAGLCLEN